MNDEPTPVASVENHESQSSRVDAVRPLSWRYSKVGRGRLVDLLMIGAGLFGIVLLYEASIGYWYRFTSPSPPAINLEGMDSQVVKAITMAQKAVAKTPGSAEAWGFLGRVLRAHEFIDPSNVCFRQAEKLDPTDPRWPYLLARGLRATDSDESLRCLRRSVARERSVNSPRLGLAEALMDRGLMDEAEDHLRIVLDQNPHDPRALLGLGRIEFTRGQLEIAADHLRRSVDMESNVKATHSMLAQIYQRLGKTEAVHEELGIMDSLAENWSWADEYQDEVTAVWVGLKARLTLSSELWKQQKRPETIEVLRALVRDYPESDKAQFLLGDKLIQTGQFKEAEPPLMRAVAINNKFARAYFELGYCLHRQNRSSEAADHYQHAIELQPDYAVAHYNLSYCLAESGDRKAAIAALRKAIRFKPDIAKAHRFLANLLAIEGEFEESEQSLERSRQLESTSRTASESVSKVPDLFEALDR